MGSVSIRHAGDMRTQREPSGVRGGTPLVHWAYMGGEVLRWDVKVLPAVLGVSAGLHRAAAEAGLLGGG